MFLRYKIVITLRKFVTLMKQSMNSTRTLILSQYEISRQTYLVPNYMMLFRFLYKSEMRGS